MDPGIAGKTAFVPGSASGLAAFLDSKNTAFITG